MYKRMETGTLESVYKWAELRSERGDWFPIFARIYFRAAFTLLIYLFLPTNDVLQIAVTYNCN